MADESNGDPNNDQEPLPHKGEDVQIYNNIFFGLTIDDTPDKLVYAVWLDSTTRIDHDVLEM